MPFLTVSLLGNIDFKYPNIEHPPYRRSLRLALLAYLIRVGKPIPRKQLSELLWPDMEPPQPRTYLRNMIQRLKVDFGDHLIISKDFVAFKFSNESAIDLIDFEEGFSTFESMEINTPKEAYRHLSHVLMLYKGKFLGEFERHVSEAFDNWVHLERQNLHAKAIEGYHKLLYYRLKEREYEQGLTDTRRLLALEPFDELAHLCMMQFFVMNNELRRAQTAFERYESLLEKDLGITGLGDEIVTLYKQIGRKLHMQRNQSDFPLKQVDPQQPDHLEEKLKQSIGYEFYSQIYSQEIGKLTRLLITEDSPLVTIVNKHQNRLNRFLLSIATHFQTQFKDGVFIVDWSDILRQSSDLYVSSYGIPRTKAEDDNLFDAIARVAKLPANNPDRSVEILLQQLKNQNSLLIINGYLSHPRYDRLLAGLTYEQSPFKCLVCASAPIEVSREITVDLSELEFATIQSDSPEV